MAHGSDDSSGYKGITLWFEFWILFHFKVEEYLQTIVL